MGPSDAGARAVSVPDHRSVVRRPESRRRWAGAVAGPYATVDSTAVPVSRPVASINQERVSDAESADEHSHSNTTL